jgi:hypothetical protein
MTVARYSFGGSGVFPRHVYNQEQKHTFWMASSRLLWAINFTGCALVI